jgi:hypothetical protein
VLFFAFYSIGVFSFSLLASSKWQLCDCGFQEYISASHTEKHVKLTLEASSRAVEIDAEYYGISGPFNLLVRDRLVVEILARQLQ